MNGKEGETPLDGEHEEAYETLRQMARRRAGRIPPELLASHVVEIYREADWPVMRAALEALLRRFEFARRDALRVASRPPKGKPFGSYRTRPRRGTARPYRTELCSLVPLEGSCNCPDFLRSSLGLCKHLLVVLDELAARPRKLEQALHAPPVGSARPRPHAPSAPAFRPGGRTRGSAEERLARPPGAQARAGERPRRSPGPYRPPGGEPWRGSRAPQAPRR